MAAVPAERVQEVQVDTVVAVVEEDIIFKQLLERVVPVAVQIWCNMVVLDYKPVVAE
jgi:hypothetical protein